jgi:hypothetical protein
VNYSSIAIIAMISLAGSHPILVCSEKIQASWSENSPLLRDYLTAQADNLPDQASQAAQKMLIQHYASLGNTLTPYYGTKAAQELNDLLRQMAVRSAEFIDATKKGDAQKKESELTALKQNATSVSCMISKLNPYISFCPLQEMLFSSVELFATMVNARFFAQWEQDTESYAQLRSNSYKIAQTVAEAISSAFPAQKKYYS